jgi:hypothetical protein
MAFEREEYCLRSERREKKLDNSGYIEGLLLFLVTISYSQHTTVVCGGGGLNKYQGVEADTWPSGVEGEGVV